MTSRPLQVSASTGEHWLVVILLSPTRQWQLRPVLCQRSCSQPGTAQGMLAGMHDQQPHLHTLWSLQYKSNCRSLALVMPLPSHRTANLSAGQSVAAMWGDSELPAPRIIPHAVMQQVQPEEVLVFLH
jgi:hypothetical protein